MDLITRNTEDVRHFMGAGTCPACGSRLFAPTRRESTEDDQLTRRYRRHWYRRVYRDRQRLEANALRWFECLGRRGDPTVVIPEPQAHPLSKSRVWYEDSGGITVPPTGPSLHLSWKEMACKDGTPYPTHWRSTRAVTLAQEFETIRALCGNRPIRVLSAYRTPEHNRRVGGAQHSQHLEGRALDLSPPKNLDLMEFERLIRAYAKSGESLIGGIGIYPSFIHIDTRQTRRLVVWYGIRVDADTGRDPAVVRTP